jgi:hypothetical protein
VDVHGVLARVTLITILADGLTLCAIAQINAELSSTLFKIMSSKLEGFSGELLEAVRKPVNIQALQNIHNALATDPLTGSDLSI